MHLTIMHCIEHTDKTERTQRNLIRNTNDKLYIEMGPESEPDAIYTQCMVMGTEDAEVLAGELLRIVREIREDTTQTWSESTEGVERNDGTPHREMTPPPAEPKKKKPQPA